MYSGAKQRVAHKAASSSTILFEDLKHKKQSITQVLIGDKISKKGHALEQSKLSLFVKQNAPKRQKISKINSDSDDAFIDDNEVDEGSTESASEDVDNDDLAVGGSNTSSWLSKKSSFEKKIQAAKMSLPDTSCTIETKFPPPPPMDFLVKQRAVLSSDDEHLDYNVLKRQNEQKLPNNRKTILLSDEDEEQIQHKNDTIVLGTDNDDGEWLSKANNNGNAMNMIKKKKKPEQGTLKDLKRKTGKLMKKKVKRHRASSEDEAGNESGEPDSDGGHNFREQSYDSEDSEAGEHLSAKQLKRISELEQKCLEFVNTASPEELAACEKFNNRFVAFVLDKRPFETFRELRQKTTDGGTLTGTGQVKRGQAMNFTRSLDSYLEWLENRGVLDQVLDDCRKHSKLIENELEEIRNNKPLFQPTGLNPDCTLHSYQQVGLNWLIMMNKLGLNAILADEMGLGKTIQVIAFLAWAKDQSRQNQPKLQGPHLIVVPSSTIENWMQEIAYWAPTLRVLPYYGSIEERQHLRHSARKHEVDLVLTTYNMVISRAEDRKFFKKFTLNYVIYDEGHMLRNCATQRYTNLMRIRGKRKILLTGTPLQNNLVELISLLYFTMRELFDKYCEDINSLLQMFAIKGNVLFDQHHQKTNGGRKNCQSGRKRKSSIDDEVVELDEQQIDITNKNSLYEKHKIMQAKSILQPFVLRRLKVEVLNSLPSKHERIEFCEPTTIQANLYAELVTNLRARKELNGGSGGGLDLLMQMRQVANHPLLYRRHYDDEKVVEMAKELCKKEKFYEKKNPNYLAEDLAYESDITLHMLCQKFDNTLGHFSLDKHMALDSGKCKMLDQLLPRIIDNKNEKVLIFSQFTSLLDILELYLHCRNYKFLRLDGQTPVLERQELINMFNEDATIPVFLLSTKAGGLGINLTAANHIIIHDIDMNPYNDKQAEDRCHRMGQTKDVHVVRLIGKNSIEEQMLALAQQKLELERTVTSSSGENSNAETRLSKKAMEELLQQALR